MQFSIMIALGDALNRAHDKTDGDKKIPFDITFISFSKTTGKGGKIISLKNQITCGASFNLKEHDMINVQSVVNNRHPHPIHVRLITEFNNQKVFY